jgi:hypothetical protein
MQERTSSFSPLFEKLISQPKKEIEIKRNIQDQCTYLEIRDGKVVGLKKL